MSWVYEALQRAQTESPQPKGANGEDTVGLDAAAILGEIEALACLNEEVSREAVLEPVQFTAPAIQNPKAQVEQPQEATDPETSQQNEVTRTGYPPLKLTLRSDSRLIFCTDNLGMAAEQFRILRRKLSQMFSDGGVLIVTSPTTGDGKTLTSINLSSCLAETGQSTLLIDTDLRRPSVRKVLARGSDTPGWSDLMAEGKPPQESICQIEDLRFHVAFLGNARSDPSKVINGRRFREFLGWARGNFHWVVLDTSPVLPAADVVDLMPRADGTLMVIRAESTPGALSKRAFELVGKNLRGVIFNGATISSTPDYRYLRDYCATPGD